MPTLFRLLFVLGLFAAIAYGGMVALATFGEPPPREISQPVDLPKPGR